VLSLVKKFDSSFSSQLQILNQNEQGTPRIKDNLQLTAANGCNVCGYYQKDMLLSIIDIPNSTCLFALSIIPLERCIVKIQAWMATNKLNDDKT